MTPEEKARQAFADAGVNLDEILAKGHAVEARDIKREIAKDKVVTSSQVIATSLAGLETVCPRCKTPLKPTEEYICDECDGKIKAEAQQEELVEAKLTFAECWPQRHVRKLEEFYGPALEKAESLLPMIFSGSMFLLYGHPGTGKTGMATWWEWKRLQAKRRAGIFDTAQGVLTKIKASWESKTTESVLKTYQSARYLVLDEIDERAKSEWEEYTLFDILNNRYNDELPTVLISNLALPELQKAYKPKFLTRVSESGGVVHCNWKSYR